MNLQTQIPLFPKEPKIDYHSKVVLLGSCFTENISGKLDYFKFQNVQNPFGIVFNPVSIENLVLRALSEDVFTEDDLFQHQELWHCFEVHSSLSSIDKDSVLQHLNQKLLAFKKQIEEASHIVITLGSAWVYWHEERSQLVANCHKIPQDQFQKNALPIDTITKSLSTIVSVIRQVNKNAAFIFTVSPVRHIKDGFEENMQSKAHLISAIHKMKEEVDAHYFPSFEIMMDELRDYRFYEKDMLHPNELAIDYIWEKFKTVWIDPETETLQKEIATIQKGLLHKPFNPNSEAHLKFREALLSRIKILKKSLPHIDF